MQYAFEMPELTNEATPHTSVLESFGEGITAGFSQTTPVLALDALGINKQSMQGGAPISEDDWKESQWYRPTLKYTPGLTDAQAAVMADGYDHQENIRIDRLMHPIAFGAGEMTGSMADPAYFLPVARALRPFLEARIGSRILTGAVEAGSQIGAGQAVQEVARGADEIANGQGVDVKAAVERIAWATLGAATLGAGGRALARMSAEHRLDAALRAGQSVEDGTPMEPPPDPVQTESDREGFDKYVWPDGSEQYVPAGEDIPQPVWLSPAEQGAPGPVTSDSLVEGFTPDQQEAFNDKIAPLEQASSNLKRAFRLAANCRGI